MVEIILAVGVVAIAIGSIMGLVPVALKANRDATAENCVSSAYDLVKTFVDQQYLVAANSSAFCVLFNVSSSQSEITNRESEITNREGLKNVLVGCAPVGLYSTGTTGYYYFEMRSGDLSKADDSTGVGATGKEDSPDVHVDFSALVRIKELSFSSSEYYYLPPNPKEVVNVSGSTAQTKIGEGIHAGSAIGSGDLIKIQVDFCYPVDAPADSQTTASYILTYPGK